MPVYPAAMNPLPQPMTGQTRWHPAKVTAAVLCFVAVVFVVSSSFLPMYSGEISFGADSVDVTFSPWSAEFGGDFPREPLVEVPPVGYPMVFAAVVLACAAAVCWYAATPTASQTARRAAGVTTAIGSAFLIGTTWTTAVLAGNGVDSFLLLGAFGQGLESDADYLVGYWLLLLAALLGFVAAVLSLLPTGRPAWQPLPPPVNPYMATPPFGIALPMQPPQQAPMPLPGQVNPLTGHPVQVDPLTGQPAPFTQSGPPPLDPLTGQPVVFAQSGLPVIGPIDVVDPLTGQPLGHHPISPPAGLPAPAHVPDPAANALPLAFTPEPVGQVNGTPAEPPPIVLPDPPPLPETPPGPAIPPTEDPLAEPPRT